MADVRYLVPYQVDVIAKDATTSKPIQNTFYFKTGLASSSPPIYGAPVAGSSSQVTLLTSFITNWEANIVPLLSDRWELPTYRIRAILGKQYASPTLAISAVSLGTPVTISTSGPHGYASGEQVSVQGVTTPAAINGNWVITVTSTTSFTLDGSSVAGSWSNNGTVQLVTGRLQFLYADLYETNTAATGGVTGDALPPYVSIDVRRINDYTGRHFRSRFGLGLIGEADQTNGALTNAAVTALSGGLSSFIAAYSNGGSDTGFSGDSRHYVLSRAVALSQASPYTSSNGFTAPVTAFLFRTRLGSQVSRKGRLT